MNKTTIIYIVSVILILALIYVYTTWFMPQANILENFSEEDAERVKNVDHYIAPVNILGTSNLGHEVSERIIKAENKCRKNPERPIDYIKYHQSRNFEDDKFLKTINKQDDGDCAFYVDKDQNNNTILRHSAVFNGEPNLKLNDDKIMHFNQKAKDFFKGELSKHCSGLEKPCDLQTKDGMCVAIMDTDDSMRFYGKPRTLIDFDIIGPEQSKPIIPQSDNREYVLLPENLNKPKEQGGPFYQCACFNENEIRENDNKFTDSCVKPIYEKSGCRMQGLDYLKQNHRDQYNKLVQLKPTEIGNIALMSGKLSILNDFANANQSSNLNGGLFYQEGELIDTAEELKERGNVCYGEGRVQIKELGGDEIEGYKNLDRANYTGTSDDYLKMYQKAFVSGLDGSLDLCTKEGTLYPDTLDKIKNDGRLVDGIPIKQQVQKFERKIFRLKNKITNLNAPWNKRNIASIQCTGIELPKPLVNGLHMVNFSGKDYEKVAKEYASASITQAALLHTNDFRSQNAVESPMIHKEGGGNSVTRPAGWWSGNRTILYFTGFLDFSKAKLDKDGNVKIMVHCDDDCVLRMNNQFTGSNENYLAWQNKARVKAHNRKFAHKYRPVRKLVGYKNKIVRVRRGKKRRPKLVRKRVPIYKMVQKNKAPTFIKSVLKREYSPRTQVISSGPDQSAKWSQGKVPFELLYRQVSGPRFLKVMWTGTDGKTMKPIPDNAFFRKAM